MSDDWVFIGWESSEQLAVQERGYLVKRICRTKYVRKQQDSLDISENTTIAPILQRAIVDVRLSAKIFIEKYRRYVVN